MLKSPVALVLLLIGSAMSAEYFWGRCPSAPPMKDFEMDKLVGMWFIVEAFDSGEKCMTWNITKGDEPNVWKIVEDKENGALYSSGLSHAKFNSGSVTQPDKKNPAKMKSYWPISGIAGDTEFTVHDTDYLNFASVFECQNVGLFHRQNGLILSRTPVLRVDLRQMARIRTKDIKVPYYRRVIHSGCKYRSTLHLDDSTASYDNFGPRGAEVGEAFGLGGDQELPQYV